MFKPDLIIFSPLPPVKSGIADYVYEQLPHFSRFWRVLVVVDAGTARKIPKLPENVRAIEYSDFAKNRNDYSRIPRIYHQGNNVFHEYVFREARQYPGILVLHDFVQHHLITEMTLARNDPGQYRKYLAEELGDLGGHLATERENGKWSRIINFLVPLNAPVLKKAQAVIVHSEWSRMNLKIKRPELPVKLIPHHFSMPEEYQELGRDAARAHLGIPKDELIIASLGFVTEPKQTQLAISALGKIQDHMPGFRYVLCGEAQDAAGLSRLADQAGIADKVRITGYVSLEDMHRYIEASDIIVNLRYPSAGETSGTLVRALGMGRAAVVFDYASFTDYPHDVAMKVPLNTIDSDALADAILELSRNDAKRSEFEVRAREYITEKHDLEKCVSAYRSFVETVNA